MRRTILLSAVLALAALPGYASQKQKPAGAAALGQLVSQGDLQLAAGQLKAAMNDFQEGDKLSGHSCVPCYLGMAEINRRSGDLVAALGETGLAVKAAGGNKPLAAQALLSRGAIIAEMANDGSYEKVEAAVSDFRKALALDPALAAAHFDLGVLLLRHKFDAEGKTELEAYLAAAGPGGRAGTEAMRFIADPRLARPQSTLQFSLATASGQTLTNGSLAGKVVLFDFWATWCAPCRAALPMLMALQRRYMGRPVEIVSICEDSPRSTWQKYIAGHHLDWPQSYDSSGRTANTFGVSSFPTYILIDGRDAPILRLAGYGGETELELSQAINKALRASRQ